jgi:hypothetical protein
LTIAQMILSQNLEPGGNFFLGLQARTQRSQICQGSLAPPNGEMAWMARLRSIETTSDVNPQLLGTVLVHFSEQDTGISMLL